MMNLLYINWEPNVEIFNFLGLSIRYYGLFFMIGLILGNEVVKYYYRKEYKGNNNLDKLFIYILFGTIIGARLGHCLFYEPEYFLKHPIEMFLPVQKDFSGTYKFVGYSGLASHGGGIGVLIAIFLFSLKYKQNIWFILDKVALAVPLVGTFIRLGNLMNSEIIGKSSNLPWAFIFRNIDNIPRHPSQLYEAVFYFFIFLILNIIYPKIKVGQGFIFGMFLVMLFSMRFLIEFTKENQVNFENDLFINMGQILSIPFILIGFLLMYKFKRRVTQRYN